MISCIIPFYNESESLINTISQLKKVPFITQIICVDDGSNNNLSQKVEREHPSTLVIRQSKNFGKSEAVKTGLQKVKNPYILLFDADLQNVNSKEIEHILQKFLSNPPDMLIFQVKTTRAALDGFINRYVVFSGARILKKEDLALILSNNPKKYGLESATNDYFLAKNGQVLWTKSSLVNIGKLDKRGFLKGLLINTNIELDLIKFSGFRNHLRQLFFFARKELT